MNFRIILALFCVLLVMAPDKSFFDHYSHAGKKRLPILSQNPLINAYFTGNKKNLPSQLKKVHQTLNLQHLMTPSGLHLASFLFVLGLFIKKKILVFVSLAFLGVTLYPYSGIASLKRMILFGLIRKNPFIEISLKNSFLMTFIITFVFGQYHENPLSFSLCFIFLGALIYSSNRLMTFIFLISIQSLLSHWLEKSFDPIGALFGLILSLMSPLLFPLLFLEAFIPFLPISKLWTGLISIISQLCTIPVRYPFFSLLPLILLFPRPHLRKALFLITFLFLTTPLGKHKNNPNPLGPPPKDFIKKVSLKNGTKFLYENGMRCYSRLKGDHWSHHCYK